MRLNRSQDDIALFVAVAEAGSLSEAGRQTGLSASSVARRMDDLERDLGARLLTRTTRRLALTEAGLLFLDRARRITLDIEEARAAVAGLDAEPRGLLRVDAPVAFGRRYVAAAVAKLMREHPDLAVDFTLHDHHLDLVENGVDVAVRLGRLPDSGLVAVRLAPLRRAVCASPAYLRENGSPKTPKDLAGHQCLVIEDCPGASRAWHFADGGALAETPVGGRLRVNNTELLLEAALQGLGLAHLPLWLAGDDLVAGRLAAVLTAYEAGPNEEAGIYVLRPSARQESAKVRAFVAVLRAHLAEALDKS